MANTRECPCRVCGFRSAIEGYTTRRNSRWSCSPPFARPIRSNSSSEPRASIGWRPDLSCARRPSRAGGSIIRPSCHTRGIGMRDRQAAVRTLTRAAIVVVTVVAPLVWYACQNTTLDSPLGPARAPSRLIPDLRAALAAQRRHTNALLDIPGVVGTAVTERGEVLLLVERTGIPS